MTHQQLSPPPTCECVHMREADVIFAEKISKIQQYPDVKALSIKVESFRFHHARSLAV